MSQKTPCIKCGIPEIPTKTGECRNYNKEEFYRKYPADNEGRNGK